MRAQIFSLKLAVILASGTAVLSFAGCGRAPALSSSTTADVTDTGATSTAGKERDRAPPSGTASEPTQLTQQVTQLQRELADLRLQISHLPGNGQAAISTPNPRTDANARMQAEQADRLRMATSESAFRSEPTDVNWSRSTTAALRATLLEGEDASKRDIRSIECRSQSCRIEIGAGASGHRMADLPLRLMQFAQTLPNASGGEIDQGDGRRATVMYLSR